MLLSDDYAPPTDTDGTRCLEKITPGICNRLSLNQLHCNGHGNGIIRALSLSLSFSFLTKFNKVLRTLPLALSKRFVH